MSTESTTRATWDPRADMPLRVPRTLKDRLAHAARVNRRSLNAECTVRLERSFDAAVELVSPDESHESPH